MKCLLIKSCILCILVMFLIVVFTGCGNSNSVKLTITEERVIWHMEQEPITITQGLRVGDTIILEAFSLDFFYITVLEIRQYSVRIRIERIDGLPKLPNRLTRSILSSLLNNLFMLYVERYETEILFGNEYWIGTDTFSSWTHWKLNFTRI